MSAPVAVLGATGRTGATVCRALVAAGLPVQALIRRADTAAAPAGGADASSHDGAAEAGAGLPAVVERVLAPDPAAQAAAGAAARSLVSCAPAEATTALLAALPRPGPHLVLIGSTRRYSRLPDPRAAAVRALEDAFLASGRPGVLLHPTMIYGAAGENNVRRIAALARFGVIPLPGGGRSLIQPVHVEDLARAVVAAVARRAVAAEPIVLAGPEAVTYAEFVRAVGRAAGRPVRVLAVPLAVALAVARIAALIPGLPRVSPAEVRRLCEEKAFDIGPAQRLLGFAPMPLEAGLALTFRRRDMPP